MRRGLGFALLLVVVAVSGCVARTVPPAVISVSPRPGTEGVPADAAVMLLFDRDMDPDSINGNIAVSPTTGYSVDWEDATRCLIRPRGQWPTGQITVTIGPSAADRRGLRMGEPFELTFSVIGGGLRVSRMIPGDGSTKVDTAVTIEVEFDREVSSAPAPAALSLEPEAPGITLISGKTLRFIPDGLTPATNYRVTVSDGWWGVRGVDGSTLDAPHTFSFWTREQSYLWEVSMDGSQRYVGELPERVLALSYSPDGTRLAVVAAATPAAEASAQAGYLLVSDVDGSNVRTVTDGPLWLELNSAEQFWSPDGGELLFSWAPDPERPTGVWRARADGLILAQAHARTDELKVASPAWSPDGARIAYRTFGDWTSRIYVGDETGEREVAAFAITAPQYCFRVLTWTPCGNFITVDEEGGGGSDAASVWSVDVGDGSVKKLVDGYRHAWSPDGSRLAFVNDGLWVTEPGGVPVYLGGGEFMVWGPSWSADGAWIAYEEWSDGASGPGTIWIVSSDGSSVQAVRVAGMGANGWHPVLPRLLVASGQKPGV